ncbi:hypothetical protein U9M48_025487 [Paspalum notatum var. saurae]|uniref:protein-serine/threonine phosphatase n=1 Tax=Paspalum notatum var. saurae TaxID=547442 RepID=A0AAQ3TV18_PASNO
MIPVSSSSLAVTRGLVASTPISAQLSSSAAQRARLSPLIPARSFVLDGRSPREPCLTRRRGPRERELADTGLWILPAARSGHPGTPTERPAALAGTGSSPSPSPAGHPVPTLENKGFLSKRARILFSLFATLLAQGCALLLLDIPWVLPSLGFASSYVLANLRWFETGVWQGQLPGPRREVLVVFWVSWIHWSTCQVLDLSLLICLRMGIYLSTPKTDKLSENGENDRLKFGLSSMQGWRASMEDAHSALLDLDSETAFFGVFDGHGGRVVAKFCAKYLHSQVLKSEAYSAGDLGTAAHRAFFRMDEMMRGQRGWRELSALGDKINKFSGMIEGLIWSPRGSDSNNQQDDWALEEVHMQLATTAFTFQMDLTLILLGQHAYNLSRDHKPELAAERERIMKAGGFIHMGRVNGSLNLSRAIGDVEFKQNKFLPPEKQIVTANPDINVVELCDDDDFVIVACDGIWDCMSSQQLVDFIHERINKERSLSAVCERVLDRCLAPSTIGGDGCDNMTMILVQFKKPVNRKKEAEVAEQSARSADETEIQRSGKTKEYVLYISQVYEAGCAHPAREPQIMALAGAPLDPQVTTTQQVILACEAFPSVAATTQQ